ncbi:hypothetical protein AYK24_05325 [Thermoplasmatales archaeon SG8-52-4]|nr:MAG: hypothetical protein AYK24_05325 [Thermoplasmatales archaeon SG8-52-4]
MKKHCKKCGNEFSENINYCTNCGDKLEDIKVTSDYKIEQPKKHEPMRLIKPKLIDKFIKPLILIAFFLSIIAIIISVALSQPTLTSGSVGFEELANNAVTSSKIADGEITDDDIASIGISKIAAFAISGDKLANNVIKLIHLSSEVNNAITCAAEVANNSITSNKIKDYSVESIDLKNNSITSEKIPADTIGSSEIAEGAVGASEIATESVDTVDIADDAITYDKMDIKIRYGIKTDATNGSTISHGLGDIPATVILTPIYNDDNYIIYANVFNIGSNSFSIDLWKVNKITSVISEVTSNVGIYWIAIL